MVKDNIKFLKVALLGKYPGAVTRSSKYVVKDVLDLIGSEPLHTVIEYGPGDGVMTLEILKRLSPDGKMLAVEINPDFLKMLRKIPDSRLRVEDAKIQDVSENIRAYGFNDADLVLSSVPFSFLSKTEREKVVRATEQTLARGGMFVIFNQTSYIMPKLLKKTFGKVKTRLEPRNIPPCLIISAAKKF